MSLTSSETSEVVAGRARKKQVGRDRIDFRNPESHLASPTGRSVGIHESGNGVSPLGSGQL